LCYHFFVLFVAFFVCDLYYGHSGSDCLDDYASNLSISIRVLLLVSGYTIFVNFWAILMVTFRYENINNENEEDRIPFKLEILEDYEKEIAIWRGPVKIRIFYFIWIVVMFLGIKDDPCSDSDNSILTYLQISTWFKLLFCIYDCLLINESILDLEKKKEELYPDQSSGIDINNSNASRSSGGDSVESFITDTDTDTNVFDFD
jgi:hypothetical protein